MDLMLKPCVFAPVKKQKQIKQQQCYVVKEFTILDGRAMEIGDSLSLEFDQEHLCGRVTILCAAQKD